jgi:hypothetical protein
VAANVILTAKWAGDRLAGVFVPHTAISIGIIYRSNIAAAVKNRSRNFSARSTIAQHEDVLTVVAGDW